MDKSQFLTELSSRLGALKAEDRERWLEYYSEMIDDRVEEGMSEREAVRELGELDEVVSSIISETPLSRLVGAKLEKERGLKGWHIALIVLGAPLWIPLLIALLAVLLSVYIALFALAVSAFAPALSFGVAAAACLVGGAALLFSGSLADGAVNIGLALFFAGAAILLALLAAAFTRLIIKIAKAVPLFIKTLFIGKDGSK